MLKICMINSVAYGSTGRIMLEIAELVRTTGNEAFTFSMKWRKQSYIGKQHVYFGSFSENFGSMKVGKWTGLNGCFVWRGTKQLLHYLDNIKPDIIHLHNLHNNYVNLPMLFNYIKKNKIPIVWTLHDCWAFTGQCPHFTINSCEKWKEGCYDCARYKSYPSAWVDQTKLMWKLKKRWFTNVKNVTIVTPSQWLADLVKESFLRTYSIKVINNGIDLNVFKPEASNLKERYNLKNRYIILGVAHEWSLTKGIDVFTKMAKKLPKEYQIILVGTDEEVKKMLPSNIISIHRTNNQYELVKLYSAADVFVNPTREDTFPTVNMEALACGTPVITFRTGGSPEILDEKCGIVVESDDIEQLEREIIRICEKKPYTVENCVKRAQLFERNKKFEEYIDLYENISK